MKMCQGLARLGHEVTLFAPIRAENRADVADPFGFYGVEAAFRLRRVASSVDGRRLLLCAGAMAWAAREAQPDLVYGRFTEALALSADLGFPVVLEAHLPLRTTGPLGWLRRRLLRHRNLRRIVVVSDALRQEYLTRYQVDETRIVVASDAADDPGDTAGERLGPADRLQSVYVGNLYRGKGVETVVELAEACPWADFHVVGGEAAQLQAWREPAARLTNLHFHGHVPHGQTDGYRLGADVLLAPYHQRVETHGAGEASRWMSPLKLFEYMAAGRAILVSDLPVLREVVRDEVHVLMCKPEDTSAWVVGLRRLADDPALRDRLGRAARAEFLRAHTWVVRARTALNGVTTEPPGST
jgi:glycosyltransferase involved in cell wall biosynthesis